MHAAVCVCDSLVSIIYEILDPQVGDTITYL